MRHYIKSFYSLLSQSIAFILAAVLSQPVLSENIDAKHSFQSCSLITTELLTAAQFYNRGVPLEELIDSLPNLTSQGEKKVRSTYALIEKSDLLSSYSAINSDYAKCAKQVYANQGKPSYGSREYGYYFCAGENKLRYEIILAIFLKQTPAEVIPQIPQARRNIAIHYFELSESEGLEAVFDLMASSLKHCITQIDAP